LSVDIYSSNKHFGKHLAVPAVSKGYKLPVEADPDFGSLTLINARLEIFAGRPSATLDAADVIAQIKDKGYTFHAYRRLR
jgi:hypothetical protein